MIEKYDSRGVIRFFSGNPDHAENAFLSNFYESPIFIDGREWASVEHYYQAYKTSQSDVRAWVRSAPNPYFAKKAGRAAARPEYGGYADWDDRKDEVMWRALRAKFKVGSEMAQRLVATGEALLEEDSPTDKYWGRLGRNRLGEMLMELREELK